MNYANPIYRRQDPKAGREEKIFLLPVPPIAKSKSLAEIAQDERIVRLDVPRRLNREIDITGSLVEAVQFRHRFNRTGKDTGGDY
jgi:hypothetical protein